jgi:hypothetical protein
MPRKWWIAVEGWFERAFSLMLNAGIFIAVLFGLVGLLAVPFGIWEDLHTKKVHQVSGGKDGASRTEEELRAELASIRSEVQSLKGAPKETGAPTDTPDRLGRLEAAIISDPSKALAIPLLRRDVENLSSRLDAMERATNVSIDRSYDLMRYFIFVIAVSIFGLGLKTFVIDKKRPPSS